MERPAVIARPRVAAALLVALTLAAAAPAAIQAAEVAAPGTTPAAALPIDTNLLVNGGFEQVATDASIPGWTVDGDVHVETFGTRPWPYPAYGKKYNGGKRYLICGNNGGTVRQTIDVSGNRTAKLKAHLQADFGGKFGHSIRVAMKISGGGRQIANQDLKALTITDHYKRAVTTVGLYPWAQRIDVTIELVGNADQTKCRVVADTIKLLLWQT